MAGRLRKKLGVFLREKRGEQTLKQFAKKVGISDSTLQRLEIGTQNITIDTLENISDRLKCDISLIFAEKK